MTPLLQKTLTLICIVLIAMGIIAGLLQLAIYLNQFWSYPLGAGISVLVILAVFEIVDRSK
jgi:uncharacterized membrane protein